MSPTPDLQLAQIQDQYVRKNFQNLIDYFSGQNQLLNFRFFEQVFTEAITGQKLAHGLGVVPLDILVTHISGAGKVTFKYGSFDESYIVMDVTGACRIRFFAGTYFNLTSQTQTQTSDAQAVESGV